MIYLNNIALASSNGSLLSQVFVMMLGVFAAAYLLKNDVQTGSVWNVFILAVIIIILNKTIGAIIDWLATPITFLTLGLFSFVVDALVIKIADSFLSKFKVKSFGTAVFMAVIISIVTVVAKWLF